jgi:hypothetical protein
MLSETAYRAFLTQTANLHPDESRRKRAARALELDVGTPSSNSTTPDALLSKAGWRRWEEFPSKEVAPILQESNLRVEVWQRDEPPAIAVAFGGTVFLSGKDWISNLRWFLPFHDDEYTKVVTLVGPDFVKYLGALKNVSADPRWEHVEIFATGHSLGAGLAHEFAYSLPAAPEVPRVSRVYAFDPSPVTGYTSVDRQLREKNCQGLAIDRIFERGEILAVIRSAIALVYPPSVRNPSMRAVRYDFEGFVNPITAHFIGPLARQLHAAAVKAGTRKSGTSSHA